jgi:hypothetical protein
MPVVQRQRQLGPVDLRLRGAVLAHHALTGGEVFVGEGRLIRWGRTGHGAPSSLLAPPLGPT